MVYDLTLSDIPKKDFCHQNLSHVYSNRVLAVRGEGRNT